MIIYIVQCAKNVNNLFGVEKITERQVKSGNKNSRNAEKDCNMDFDEHFFLSYFADQILYNPKLLNSAKQIITGR